MNRDKLKYYYLLITERTTVMRALRVSLIVGVMLTLINHPDLIKDLKGGVMHAGNILLTFAVPYIVSTYSTLLNGLLFKAGNISRVDALLKCHNCHESDFNAKIGSQIDECPNCKKMTKWKLQKLSSVVSPENDILKSLALFARHNPQPLFRLTESGEITDANPAAEGVFNRESFTGEAIQDLAPELKDIKLDQCIDTGSTDEIQVHLDEKFYNFLFKGVPVLQVAHVYGNDITDIQNANQKIKLQAEEIFSSIQYASLIQKALLPGEAIIDQLFPSNFVFYRPRNVVSGDFYWVKKVDHFIIVAVADSTGHGVPGAFMSMLGISLLNDIILREKVYQPDQILNEMRNRLIALLSSNADQPRMSDGFDISLIAIDVDDNTLGFAGAFNPLLICREGKLNILEADKFPIGKYHGNESEFSVKWDMYKKGDRLFMFSDGYLDQFGGENNKKYSRKRFKDLIIQTDHLPFDQVEDNIVSEFDQWKSDFPQIDDVLVLGIENLK